MSLPTISGTARLTGEPELRFAPSGTAVCKFNLAFNSRRKDEAGNWVDGDTFFVNAVAFKQLAENAAESLTKGTEVVVTGRLKTEQWQDKQTGDKRSAPSLLVDSIGPSIAFATAKVQKAARTNGGGQPRQDDDQWASATPARSGNSSSSFEEAAPF
jgi:single-strand DNA-binding protein